MQETRNDERPDTLQEASADVPLGDEEYREVAEAIGLIAMEWSRLHDTLSQMFARVSRTDRAIAYKIWNSAFSDSQQRRMLQAAVDEAYKDEQYFKAREDITELIKKVDKTSPSRNNFIHSPFSLMIEGHGLVVIPNYFSNNKHAEKLKNSELLPALEEQRLKIVNLHVSALEVMARLPKFGNYA